MQSAFVLDLPLFPRSGHHANGDEAAAVVFFGNVHGNVCRSKRLRLRFAIIS
jgi:hypothetical protein